MRYVSVDRKFLEKRCQERGYSLASVMPCVVSKKGTVWTIDTEHSAYPHPRSSYVQKENAKPNQPAPKDEDGPGTELKKLLSYFNIKSSENCSCAKKAKIMNREGTDWCRNNKSIIISWLEQEANKRKLPFFKIAASKLIDLAISRAERKKKKK